MALDINGYNAAFKAFVDFAQQKMDAGETKAVARGEVQDKVFDGRVIKAATTDEAYAFTRSADEKYFNEVAREQFKRAIIDMFGGESNIPENVRKAMLLGDYGSGKPLTARRIMAVKNAIDADGTARARSADARQREFDASISKFSSPEVEAAALAKGYSKAELPRLAAAANLYAKEVHCSEADALADKAFKMDPKFVEALWLKADIAHSQMKFADEVGFPLLIRPKKSMPKLTTASSTFVKRLKPSRPFLVF